LPFSVKDGEAAGAAGLSLIEQGKTQIIRIEAMHGNASYERNRL
jgi:hypothetical protein